MTDAQIKSVQCISPAGLHRMAYKEWGDPANSRVLVCVHGLTRVSDDFDALARELCGHYRVVCPDVVGRGRSDWLRNPMLYRTPQYVSDMVTLLARVLPAGEPQSVDWVGTSMGGMIGMGLAAQQGNPVRRLVLNDIGPTIDQAALKRIGEYVGTELCLPDFDTAAAYIRQISQPFGPHSDAQWHKLAADVLRQRPDGQWTRNYDLGLAQPFLSVTPDSFQADSAVLAACYDALRCPTLVLRGAESDLLSVATAQAMTGRGPKARLVEFPGVGHAPTLLQADQIAVVKEFLLGD